MDNHHGEMSKSTIQMGADWVSCCAQIVRVSALGEQHECEKIAGRRCEMTSPLLSLPGVG